YCIPTKSRKYVGTYRIFGHRKRQTDGASRSLVGGDFSRGEALSLRLRGGNSGAIVALLAETRRAGGNLFDPFSRRSRQRPAGFCGVTDAESARRRTGALRTSRSQPLAEDTARPAYFVARLP